MRRKAKSALTLLEVNIAIFITGILLTALWGMYHSWYKSYDKTGKIQMKIHTFLFVKHRLEQLFRQMGSFEKNFLFTPSKEFGNSLFLSYPGAPDPDPFFNKTIRSLLYVDEQKRLCLASRSPTLDSRVEILSDKVSLLEFSFFDAQTNVWKSSWSDEEDHLPLFVKIRIKRLEQEENMIFRVYYPKEPILYLEAFEGGL